MYNKKIFNRWYRDKHPIPSAEKEHAFWENVFVEENEQRIRDTILRYDLGHVLEQYIQQRNCFFKKELQTHPSYVQAHMDCWWHVTCNRGTPKCTQVLHNFFATPHTSMASPNRLSSRLNDMMDQNLWEVALHSMCEQINADTSHRMLEKIMSNDGEWIQKNDWTATLKKLAIYLSNGGEFDAQHNQSYQHIFNTHWMSDMLILEKYKTRRPKMLKQLFRCGVHFHTFDFSVSDVHKHVGLEIDAAWSEHTKEQLMKHTHTLGAAKLGRKI